MVEHGTDNTRQGCVRRPARGLVAVAAAVLLASACTSSGGSGRAGGHSASPGPEPASALAPVHGRYSPRIVPSDFVRVVDNPYWPLPAGTGYHYTGVRGTTSQTDDEIVLHRTKRIAGVTCTVVRDTVAEHGRAVERTFDYYAQDRQGNVWYMGEDSFELENRHLVRASDSWLTGVDGGKPGIIMPADPRPGEAYRQECYAAGVGELAERVVKGHHEAFQLVRVTHGRR